MNTVSLDRLREVFAYDPETGIVRNRITRHNKSKSGDSVGRPNYAGYLLVTVDRVVLRVHRIAWMLHYGSDAAGDIDHINGICSDNRIENLRQATRRENLWNRGATKINTSGAKGVSWDKRRRKWRSRIGVNYKKIVLGYFSTVEEAAEAYREGAKKYHGEFANSGPTKSEPQEITA